MGAEVKIKVGSKGVAFRCPECKKTIIAPHQVLGMSMKCTNCGATVETPTRKHPDYVAWVKAQKEKKKAKALEAKQAKKTKAVEASSSNDSKPKRSKNQDNASESRTGFQTRQGPPDMESDWGDVNQGSEAIKPNTDRVSRYQRRKAGGGFATAGLVLGILSVFLIFPALPGLVLSIIGTVKGQGSKAVFGIVLSCVGMVISPIAFVVIVTVVLGGALSVVREKAQQQSTMQGSMSNLQAIYYANEGYASNKGSGAGSASDLVAENYLQIDSFTCPFNKDEAYKGAIFDTEDGRKAIDFYVNQQSSYIINWERMKAMSPQFQHTRGTILAYCILNDNQGIIALYGDGETRLVKPDDKQQFLDEVKF